MTRISHTLLRLSALLLIAGLALTGWTYWFKASDRPLHQRYQFEEVTTGDLTQTVTANGTVNPVGLVNVGTQVSGTVRKLYVDFNDRVKAGQVLLELDPTTTQAAVEQSSGELANARATLRLARADEQRMRELFAQEYVSRQDLDKAVQAREAAEAQVRTAQGKLMRDRANLGYTVIRSPVSGVVVSREVDLGQTVAASFQTPTLFKIARDLSRMQIDSNVAEADIGKVRTGQLVRFTVDAYPERRFEGRVQQIRLAPITQQNVVTYNVVVEVSNPDLVLMPGMTAYLSIVTDQVENALLVPNAALRFKPSDLKAGDAKSSDTKAGDGRSGAAGGGSGGQSGAPTSGRGMNGGPKRPTVPTNPTVYVARDEAVVPVVIQIGISDGRRTVVKSGDLKPGDRVAVEELLSDRKQSPGGTQQPFRIRAF
ncbi:MAG TPA: efflux RND transporter periplasmic adaptor subunit [Burkholderiales bacterium]|nr:efflux RND transporter periplasmic adaptor subunit [Burkholderiales bacterium]